MNYVVCILLAIIAMIAANEYTVKKKEDLMRFRKECVQLRNVSAEMIEKYKKFEFPDDEPTHCYIECIFDKFGLFNAESGFQKESLIKQLGHNRNADEIKTEIEKCIDANEQHTDSCKWVFRGFKCFIEKNLSLVQESIKN